MTDRADTSDFEDRETPWWASSDPAGHEDTDANSHGDHARPAWADAAEVFENVARTTAKAARGMRIPSTIAGVAEGARAFLNQDEDEPAGWQPADGWQPGRPGNQAPPSEHRHGIPDQYCAVCPVCSLLRTVDETHPEVIGHLMEAARHFSLAAKAIVDAQVERLGGAGGLEHISLDD